MKDECHVIWTHRHGEGARRSVIALLRFPTSTQLRVYWEGVWDERAVIGAPDLDSALARGGGPYAAFSPDRTGLNAALMFVDLMNPGAEPQMQRMKVLHEAAESLDRLGN